MRFRSHILVSVSLSVSVRRVGLTSGSGREWVAKFLFQWLDWVGFSGAARLKRARIPKAPFPQTVFRLGPIAMDPRALHALHTLLVGSGHLFGGTIGLSQTNGKIWLLHYLRFSSLTFQLLL